VQQAVCHCSHHEEEGSARTFSSFVDPFLLSPPQVPHNHNHNHYHNHNHNHNHNQSHDKFADWIVLGIRNKLFHIISTVITIINNNNSINNENIVSNNDDDDDTALNELDNLLISLLHHNNTCRFVPRRPIPRGSICLNKKAVGTVCLNAEPVMTASKNSVRAAKNSCFSDA
jgi:ABC-type Zn2+ transport system substrate-binding protein/surface adhesin